MTIFCFGGFYGSLISFILYRCGQHDSAGEHGMRVSGKFCLVVAAIGSMFCWIFMPCLNIDFPNSLAYGYLGGVNAIYCISASTITCLGLSCLFYGRIDLKDLIYGPVIGGVMIGSSSVMITNSVGAILMGIGAAILHIILMQIEHKLRWVALV
jgi:hypothetical protein